MRGQGKKQGKDQRLALRQRSAGPPRKTRRSPAALTPCATTRAAVWWASRAHMAGPSISISDDEKTKQNSCSPPHQLHQPNAAVCEAAWEGGGSQCGGGGRTQHGLQLACGFAMQAARKQGLTHTRCPPPPWPPSARAALPPQPCQTCGSDAPRGLAWSGARAWACGEEGMGSVAQQPSRRARHRLESRPLPWFLLCLPLLPRCCLTRRSCR